MAKQFIIASWKKPTICRSCGEDIYFLKSNKGKWFPVQTIGFGSNKEYVAEYHKCGERTKSMLNLIFDKMYPEIEETSKTLDDAWECYYVFGAKDLAKKCTVMCR